MSSPPLTPATTASKRLSLNVSIGPRPLHLVDGNVPSQSPGPRTAPLATSCHSLPSGLPSPPSSSKKAITYNSPNPRRQSSISYRPNTNDVDLSLQGSVRHELTRSWSAGPTSSILPTSPRDRRSAGLEAHATQERPPLTLAEKHSELLHFIAQKESKCLELRSQLATHEAELLQLKRKWERIVNRRFLDETSSLTQGGQSNGAVLEGIREGVQGVSRFIAAGLAIGELSPVPASSLPQSSTPVSRPHRPIHTNSQSSSSTSTYTTKSTRFSQSSVSSLGGEPPPPCEKEETGEDSAQILMVHDTGATPTMSPNPAFEHQRQQRESSTRSSFEAEKDTFPISSKLHRRRSRDVHSFENMVLPGEDLSSNRSVSSVKAMEERKLEAARVKRASIIGTEFPPVSSIPGLASLTVGVASPPVASWVGSVGKKWDELQRGSTFSKNQKRASILLSDVSQSIVSALSSPHSASTSKSPSPIPRYFSPSPTSPLATSTTPTSLLDDDDFTMPTSSVMTPDPSPLLKPTSRPLPTMATKANAKIKPKPKDDEDEWNW
ncbi:hypothetical protein FPV67DRAFT_1531120 [Lyophyllum atratum]|nr:hypothetical protein FPV67DRAFT_1531120 [Lyophyllum atratum]